LQKLLPVLTEQDLQPGGAGVRAQAMDRKGKLLDDFQFGYQDRVFHVCNVPSPAATASLMIGKEIVAALSQNSDFTQMQSVRGYKAGILDGNGTKSKSL
jgi:L-2-hydroxyglutarate oxidase LhgO